MVAGEVEVVLPVVGLPVVVGAVFVVGVVVVGAAGVVFVVVGIVACWLFSQSGSAFDARAALACLRLFVSVRLTELGRFETALSNA